MCVIYFFCFLFVNYLVGMVDEFMMFLVCFVIECMFVYDEVLWIGWGYKKMVNGIWWLVIDGWESWFCLIK